MSRLLTLGVGEEGLESVEPFILGVEVVLSVEPFDMIGPPVSVLSVEIFEIQGPQAVESIEPFAILGPLMVSSEEPFSMLGTSVEVFPGGYVASPLIGWRDPR